MKADEKGRPVSLSISLLSEVCIITEECLESANNGFSKLNFETSSCIASYFGSYFPEHKSSLRFGNKYAERNWLCFLIHKKIPFPYLLHRQEILEVKGKLFKLTLGGVLY